MRRKTTKKSIKQCGAELRSLCWDCAVGCTLSDRRLPLPRLSRLSEFNTNLKSMLCSPLKQRELALSLRSSSQAPSLSSPHSQSKLPPEMNYMIKKESGGAVNAYTPAFPYRWMRTLNLSVCKLTVHFLLSLASDGGVAASSTSSTCGCLKDVPGHLTAPDLHKEVGFFFFSAQPHEISP